MNFYQQMFPANQKSRLSNGGNRPSGSELRSFGEDVKHYFFGKPKLFKKILITSAALTVLLYCGTCRDNSRTYLLDAKIPKPKTEDINMPVPIPNSKVIISKNDEVSVICRGDTLVKKTGISDFSHYDALSERTLNVRKYKGACYDHSCGDYQVAVYSKMPKSPVQK